MSENRTFDQAGETLVGGLVLAAAGLFLGFAMLQAGDTGGGGSGQRLVARFDQAVGVAPGVDVRVSGVKVGAVSRVSLDENYAAVVELTLDQDVGVPVDSSIRVASDGLLGGAFIAIEPGGAEEMLPAGGEFEFTQGSVDLITLFAGLMRSSGSADSGGGARQGPEQ